MLATISQRLRYSPARPVYDWFAVRRWHGRGRPIPPPYALKRRTVLEYARTHRLDVLVETGTYRGDMMYFAKSRFRKAYSIELEPTLFKRNKHRFRNAPNIELIEGDSGVELPKLVATLDRPTLFWLDGHYSGEGTGKGALFAPIMQELSCIFQHPVRSHVMLIDDARLFDGTYDYPRMEELRAWVAKERPDFTFEVRDDIIRIDPPKRS